MDGQCPLRKMGLVTSSTLIPTAMAFFRAKLPDWPAWAMNLMMIMASLLGLTIYSTAGMTTDTNFGAAPTTQSREEEGKETKRKNEFDVFRHKYIIVYLVVMLADWMQGTHMYTLYLSYNVNVSALFLTGFLSGAIFAPFLGSAVDKYGRKKSCILYCVLEVIINALEHYDNFTILLLGRVLGGISTNLLFSAFESWMTTEHRKQNFPEEWLQQTYSETSVGNGVMAIVAGILSQLLEDQLGHIGPFQGAIALTLLALLMIAFFWEENYGEESKHHHPPDTEHHNISLAQQFKNGWKATLSDSFIFRIGIIQALSEGAMYTFVFMWVPTLLSMNPPDGLPTGCVFSSLMMSITIGGLLFRPLEKFASTFLAPRPDLESETAATAIYALAGFSMLFPACILGMQHYLWPWTNELRFELVIASFVVMECCVGLFMPVQGTLRSKYVPDALQGAILNIFRLPLNVVVVLGTYATDVLEHWKVFGIVSTCLFCATLLQATMMTTKHISKTTGISADTDEKQQQKKKIQ